MDERVSGCGIHCAGRQQHDESDDREQGDDDCDQGSSRRALDCIVGAMAVDVERALVRHAGWNAAQRAA
jgi:hypothetical protein